MKRSFFNTGHQLNCRRGLFVTEPTRLTSFSGSAAFLDSKNIVDRNGMYVQERFLSHTRFYELL